MATRLKMICDLNPEFDRIVTLERYKNGDIDRNSWWYLDGQLEGECGYDKATVYNLSEFPNLRKETLRWKSITGDKAEVDSYTKHTEIHANGEFEVEMYGVAEPCIAFFWTTRERMVRTEKGISFKVWNQRGLVCMCSDTKAIERARRKMMKRTENL